MKDMKKRQKKRDEADEMPPAAYDSKKRDYHRKEECPVCKTEYSTKYLREHMQRHNVKKEQSPNKK